MKPWIEPSRISVFIVTTQKLRSSKNPKRGFLVAFEERHACAHGCARAVRARSVLDVQVSAPIAPNDLAVLMGEARSPAPSASPMANLVKKGKRALRVNPQLRGINSL
jgi:hypothetical protein